MALQRARELSRDDPSACMDLVNVMLTMNRFAEAEAVVAEALARKVTGRVMVFDVLLKTQWRGDLAAATATAAKWPDWLLREDRGSHLAWRAWLWNKQPEQAIEIARQIPRDYVHDYYFSRTSSGAHRTAHEIAGNLEAAEADWHEVVQLTNRELASDPGDAVALQWKGWASRGSATGRVLRLSGAIAPAESHHHWPRFTLDHRSIPVAEPREAHPFHCSATASPGSDASSGCELDDLVPIRLGCSRLPAISCARAVSTARGPENSNRGRNRGVSAGRSRSPALVACSTATPAMPDGTHDLPEQPVRPFRSGCSGGSQVAAPLRLEQHIKTITRPVTFRASRFRDTPASASAKRFMVSITFTRSMQADGSSRDSSRARCRAIRAGSGVSGNDTPDQAPVARASFSGASFSNWSSVASVPSRSSRSCTRSFARTSRASSDSGARATARSACWRIVVTRACDASTPYQTIRYESSAERVHADASAGSSATARFTSPRRENSSPG